ncbi:MAG: hypothetical protein M3321_10000, partial [Actinomycetota bacterium]|nr:hypothetical protein [Actinomycetota bacterium]
MTERRRIVLDESDFDDVPAAPAPPTSAGPAGPPVAEAALPPVARRPPVALGSAALPPTQAATWLNDPRLSSVVAAATGMALAWAVTEATGIVDIAASSESELHAVTGLWTAVVGIVFTGVLVSFEHAVAGAWADAFKRAARAAVPAGVVAFVAGVLASLVYVEVIEWVLRDVFESGDFGFSEHDPRLYLARALGWAIFGAGVGAAIGVV